MRMELVSVAISIDGSVNHLCSLDPPLVLKYRGNRAGRASASSACNSRTVVDDIMGGTMAWDPRLGLSCLGLLSDSVANDESVPGFFHGSNRCVPPELSL